MIRIISYQLLNVLFVLNRIMESDKVAMLWGIARKNANMNYEKMSRGMR